MLQNSFARAMTVYEAFNSAFITWYDCAYAYLYDSHDCFMLDMFGSRDRRGRLSPASILNAFYSKLAEYENVLFKDFDIKYCDGDLELRLYSVDGRQLMVSWSQYNGPVYTTWE